ncbi:MAG: ABC transporter ATP-binding protein, partial [Patescibacteria group bacterium]
MLVIKQLSAGYADLQILNDVNFALREGTIHVLMGPNGAGKSTLLKSIYSLTTITSGRIEFCGEDITGLPAHKLLPLGIAFVPQGRINFGTLTVRENLLMGVHGARNKTEIQKKLEEMYEQFSVLKEKEHARAFTLSGGQQQMLAIGRALMSSPKLILMDEPSLGLAPKLVKEIFEKIRGVRDHFGTTILIVEHNIKSLMS